MSSSTPTEDELRARAVGGIDRAFRLIKEMVRREREETPEEGEQVQRAAVDAVTALFLLRHHYGVDAFSATIREIEALGEMHTSILSNAMEALMEDYIEEDDDARW